MYLKGEERMKEMKSILMIGVCLFIAFFGLYMQFFSKPDKMDAGNEKTPEIVENEEEKINEEVDESTGEDQADQQPLPEEDLEAQTYGNAALNVYFTNMEEIQNDDEFLPFMGYSSMSKATEEFLQEQTEVLLPESGNIELSLSPGMTYKRHNLICFHCYLTDIDTDLEIEYVYDDTRYEYTDIHFVKKGEWDILWKK